MKLWSCIHLDEEKVNLTFSFESCPTFYGSLTFVEFLGLGHVLRNYKS